MKLKSRTMVIIAYSAFVTVNLYNIYNTTFGDANLGYILAMYTVENEEVIIWKRSVKRSIYIQILLMSMSGICTMIRDKKLELIMFATENLRRTKFINEECNDVQDDFFKLTNKFNFSFRKKNVTKQHRQYQE